MVSAITGFQRWLSANPHRLLTVHQISFLVGVAECLFRWGVVYSSCPRRAHLGREKQLKRGLFWAPRPGRLCTMGL